MAEARDPVEDLNRALAEVAGVEFDAQWLPQKNPAQMAEVEEGVIRAGWILDVTRCPRAGTKVVIFRLDREESLPPWFEYSHNEKARAMAFAVFLMWRAEKGKEKTNEPVH